MPIHCRSLVTLFLTAGLLTGVVVPTKPNAAEPAPSVDAIKKAVDDTHRQMIQAESRLDVDAFFAHVAETDQGQIIQNGKRFKTRQEAYLAVKRGFEGLTQVQRQFDDPQVQVLSPEIALLTSEGSVTVTLTDARKITSPFAVSLVFIRQGSQWKLLHGHYSLPPRP
jgi:hypothetical protein